MGYTNCICEYQPEHTSYDSCADVINVKYHAANKGLSELPAKQTELSYSKAGQ